MLLQFVLPPALSGLVGSSIWQVEEETDDAYVMVFQPSTLFAADGYRLLLEMNIYSILPKRLRTRETQIQKTTLRLPKTLVLRYARQLPDAAMGHTIHGATI